MNTSRVLQKEDAGSPLEVPTPILFNTWKHHAGALRWRIAQIAELGEAGLLEAASRIAVLGTRLMDLYTGDLLPLQVCQCILDEMRRNTIDSAEAFRSWLGEEEYRVVPLSDGSQWVLRLGDDPTFWVHLHPGRWSPMTVRVRANTLKTAFLACIQGKIRGCDPMQRALLDEIRCELLQLSPLGQDPDGDQGLGGIIALLSREPPPLRPTCEAS
jgi:hypothetical protein